MAKNRSRNYDREFDKLQNLKHENKSLKKELSRIRKELDRVQVRYSDLDDMVQQQYEETTKPSIEDLKKEWQCHKCKEDYLRLIVISRPDGTHYFRKCGSCSNKTRLKKYTEGVKGLKE